jgi:hypothetical protein
VIDPTQMQTALDDVERMLSMALLELQTAREHTRSMRHYTAPENQVKNWSHIENAVIALKTTVRLANASLLTVASIGDSIPEPNVITEVA